MVLDRRRKAQARKRYLADYLPIMCWFEVATELHLVFNVKNTH